MSNHEPIVIQFPSEPRYLGVIRAAVEAASLKMGLGEDEAARVTLAVDEAVANVIRHGYQGKPGHPIWLKMTPQVKEGRSGIEILIEDRCPGVDLTRIKSRSLDEIRPGGLGVNIIAAVMDQVEYQPREDGQGVRLRMVKFTQSMEYPAAASKSGGD
jgi:anti-sigma regulatory factor (Ser/Thr protein kinase)